MPRTASPYDLRHHAAAHKIARHAPRIPLVPLGMSLGSLLSISFVLCVLFDLWLPAYAMNPSWAPLLPGFTWISWSSFALGLVETFAYGWYFAALFAILYNFFAPRTRSAHRN